MQILLACRIIITLPLGNAVFTHSRFKQCVFTTSLRWCLPSPPVLTHVELCTTPGTPVISLVSIPISTSTPISISVPISTLVPFSTSTPPSLHQSPSLHTHTPSLHQSPSLSNMHAVIQFTFLQEPFRGIGLCESFPFLNLRSYQNLLLSTLIMGAQCTHLASWSVHDRTVDGSESFWKAINVRQNKSTNAK